jgi:hypothetical protein
MVPLAWAFVGAIIGPIGLSILIGRLDEAYRPYPDDLQMWLLYSIPSGAVFGSITGGVLGFAAQRKFKTASWVAVISALGLGLLHVMIWRSAASSPHATEAFALAQAGPGSLWSAVHFVLGIRWFQKSK